MSEETNTDASDYTIDVPAEILAALRSDGGVKARHSSKTNEAYTPAYIVEAARATLGGIDLDPFSCAQANLTVKATCYYSAPNGDTSYRTGFISEWAGRVFCNPPGGKGPNNESNQKRAWFKLATEYQAGRVTAAVFLCFSVELLQTTQSKTPAGLPLPLDFPICYPRKRVAYVREDGQIGGSPPHSSCVIYLPPKVDSSGCWTPSTAGRVFGGNFAAIGKVVIPS